MHILWGKGRVAGQVGLGQTFCRQSRVGSGQRFAGSGRVQEKLPVDNTDAPLNNMKFDIPKIFWEGVHRAFSPGPSSALSRESIRTSLSNLGRFAPLNWASPDSDPSPPTYAPVVAQVIYSLNANRVTNHSNVVLKSRSYFK